MTDADRFTVEGREWFAVEGTLYELAIDVEGPVSVRRRLRAARRDETVRSEDIGRRCRTHQRWVARTDSNDPCWAHVWGAPKPVEPPDQREPVERAVESEAS